MAQGSAWRGKTPSVGQRAERSRHSASVGTSVTPRPATERRYSSSSTAAACTPTMRGIRWITRAHVSNVEAGRAHYETVEVPGAGSFEGYTNRDCLGYIEQYGLAGIASMFRGTLRYPGWCDTLRAFGAVSRETVIEMARGVRLALAADIGMAVSGIAGPGGGTPEKPVGLACIGLSTALHEMSWSFVWSGDRRQNKEQSADAVLRLLVEYLQQHAAENLI